MTSIPKRMAERLYIIWGMIDHDLPHGGEISLILGAHGLPALSLIALVVYSRSVPLTYLMSVSVAQVT